MSRFRAFAQLALANLYSLMYERRLICLQTEPPMELGAIARRERLSEDQPRGRPPWSAPIKELVAPQSSTP